MRAFSEGERKLRKLVPMAVKWTMPPIFEQHFPEFNRKPAEHVFGALAKASLTVLADKNPSLNS